MELIFILFVGLVIGGTLAGMVLPSIKSNPSQILKSSYLELDKQCEEVLTSQGLEVNDLHKRLFAMFVQQEMSNRQIDLDPKELGTWLKKQLINEAAYYIIRPDVYKKKMEDASAAAQETAGAVEQKA